MIRPATLALRGTRTTPLDYVFEFRGIDLTDAVMAAQVRQKADNPGDPEIDLADGVSAGVTGLRLISVETVEGQPYSRVGMFVEEDDMADLPAAAEVGDTLTWYWDLKITPDGGVTARYLAGAFLIEGASTVGGGTSTGSGGSLDAIVTVSDETIVVDILGADLLAAYALAVEAGVADAEEARDVAVAAAAEAVEAADNAADVVADVLAYGEVTKLGDETRTTFASSDSVVQYFGYNDFGDGRIKRLWIKAPSACHYNIARVRPSGALAEAAHAIDHPGGGWYLVPDEDLPDWDFAENWTLAYGGSATPTTGPCLSQVGAPSNSSFYTADQTGGPLVLSNYYLGMAFERVERGIEERIEILEAGSAGEGDYADVIPYGYILLWWIDQSNGEGYSDQVSSFELTDGKGYKWDRDGGVLADLVDPTGNNGHVGGSMFPAMGSAIRTLSRGRLGLIVVNSSYSGTSVLAWSNGGTRMLEAVADLDGALDAAHALNLPIVGKAIGGFMGETDALGAMAKATYKTAVLGVVTWARTALGAETPVFVRSTGADRDVADNSAWRAIRTAQSELVRENANWFSLYTGAFNFVARTMMSDNYHHNQDAQDEIGETGAPILIAHAAGNGPPPDYTLGVARP